jgi:hypothetical protein
MKGRDYKGFVCVSEAGVTARKDFGHSFALAIDFNKRAKTSRKEHRAGAP